jgi:hypothetical protein
MIFVIFGGVVPKPMLMYQKEVGWPAFQPGIMDKAPPSMGHFVRLVVTR